MRKILIAVAVVSAVTAVAFAFACGDDGGTRYDVSVNFNETVTQEDIEETEVLLRGYDDDLEFLILESFPPIGRATLETDTPDFCAEVVAELEAKSYVRTVDCSEATDGDGGDGDPDAPVEATPY